MTDEAMADFVWRVTDHKEGWLRGRVPRLPPHMIFMLRPLTPGANIPAHPGIRHRIPVARTAARREKRLD